MITGGPGTGKTTTVVRLGLLQGTGPDGAGEPCDPPRGADRQGGGARLGESIAGVEGSWPDALPGAQSVRAAIPTTVGTPTACSAAGPDPRRFGTAPATPCRSDVLVIDEASMVDLEMMAAVLAALLAQARLILLRRQDQLASVEAGAVLGELCRRATRGISAGDLRVVAARHRHRRRRGN